MVHHVYEKYVNELAKDVNDTIKNDAINDNKIYNKGKEYNSTYHAATTAKSKDCSKCIPK